MSGSGRGIGSIVTRPAPSRVRVELDAAETLDCTSSAPERFESRSASRPDTREPEAADVRPVEEELRPERLVEERPEVRLDSRPLADARGVPVRPLGAPVRPLGVPFSPPPDARPEDGGAADAGGAAGLAAIPHSSQ
ncbi:hypothetical protein [Mangrovactinospora gilvigrisea]|uniref:hypothetical protein n=1 Tax=Mangrovactinospora gilvigrisea TaxID=1428644 RepID=UPI003AF3C746